MPGIRTTLQLSSASDRSIPSCFSPLKQKRVRNNGGKEYTNPRWFELKSGMALLNCQFLASSRPTGRRNILHFSPLFLNFNRSIIFRLQAVPRRLGISVFAQRLHISSPFPLLDGHARASRLRDSWNFKSKDNILHRYRFLLESIKKKQGWSFASYLWPLVWLIKKRRMEQEIDRAILTQACLLFSKH